MTTTLEILDEIYKDIKTDYKECPEVTDILELIDELTDKLVKLNNVN